MKNITIDKGEWYPVYSISEWDGDPSGVSKLTISDEKYAAWERIFEEFEELQQKLARIYDVT